MIADLSHRAWLGLTRNVAFTAPTAEDERLRGRTFAIPFDDVWRASLQLVDGGLKRWELVEHDDHDGIIRGTARGLLPRSTSAVTIRISLDRNAQTRVDALSASRVGRMDFGNNTRRIHRFFRALDLVLGEERGREAQREATGA
ncbi:MAG TPA: DUF1499 domain-containing protein [Longimicrobiales bacterium]|nr:DUF1499 domain-containing protein [Longimicrobiales bacterium]